MSEQSGYAAFCLYEALKLHMNDQKYDYFKYNGKIRITKDSFMNRKDKYSYYKLSRKYSLEELKWFVLSNLLVNPKIWVNDLLTDDAVQNYTKWLKRNQSITYVFENDVSKLIMECEESSKTLDDLITVKNGSDPLLLKNCYQENITLETLLILNNIMNFFPMWEKRISDDIIWPSFKLKCVKYFPFLKFEKPKLKSILIEKIKDSVCVT